MGKALLPFRKELLVFVVSLCAVLAMWCLFLEVVFFLCFPSENLFKVEAPVHCAQIHLAPPRV